jgi:hypothetical protein
MSRIPKEHLAKWGEISSRGYEGQCRWMLNGFWEVLEKDAELIWKWFFIFIF